MSVSLLVFLVLCTIGLVLSGVGLCRGIINGDWETGYRHEHEDRKKGISK